MVKAPAEDREPGRRPDHRSSPERRDDEPSPAPNRPLSAGAVQRLQSVAGNRAAAALLARRARPAPTKASPAAERPGPSPSPAPAAGDTSQVQRLAEGGEAPARPGPDGDPKFKALQADIRAKQQTMRKHPPARSEAQASQAAAKPPQDDKEAQGKAANAEKMNAAKPGEFDKAAFVKAVNDAIAAQAPKNLDEADKFSESGKADAVKSQVQGKVGEGRKASAGAIETTTKAPPDTSQAKEKQVTPLRPDQPPPTPAAPDPSKAVPDKAPASATDFSDGPEKVDNQLADAQVTEEQLAKSNEPEFTGALDAKKEGEKQAAASPGQIRAKEAQTLAGAKAQAQQAGATAMTSLANHRKQTGAQVGQGREGAKGSDEQKRAQATAKLQKVFDATKKDVEDILSGLDKKVDERFAKDEKAARDAFTAEHKRKMDEYKDERYSGFTGKLRWVKDKFAGLPEEANQIFVEARKGYVARMQQVISGIADLIGGELNRAKQRIATGRDELQAEVRKLPADLQAIGKQAAGQFSAKFDELTESVDAKGKELVDTLAGKYTEALKSVDDEIAAEKEKNKGLIAKAVDAVKGVIETILKLKDMLMGVLAKAASAVMAIISDPIGFLGKLVSAVGAGLRAFMANIGEHLKKGLLGWLLGAMASAGLQLPSKFDLRGIIMMIGSLLGLTWQAIKSRVISRGVPAPAMDAAEKSVPVAQKLASGGIGGIWEDIKEKVGDLKANLFAKITEYLIPTVLIAGITWIISLLNPASAFVKACKMIIDIVTFIIERGAQIIEFVNAVLDAVIAIAGGGTGGVPALIEGALAKSIPVLIGALAAILGIGGIAEKVKKFFQALSKPVMKAVDWVVDKIVKFGKKIWAKMKAAGKKIKDRFGKKAKKDGGGPATKEQSRQEKEEKLDTIILSLRPKIRAAATAGPSSMDFRSKLATWRAQHRLTALEVRGDTGTVAIWAKINPEKEAGQVVKLSMEMLRDIAVQVSGEVLDNPIVKSHARHMAQLRKNDPNATVPVTGRGGFLGLAKFFHNRGAAVPANKQTYAISPGTVDVQEWHGGVTRFIKNFFAKTGRQPKPRQVRVSINEAKGTVRVQNPVTGGPNVGHYHTLPNRLPKTMTDVEMGLALQQVAQTGRMPAGVTASDQQMLGQLAVLMFGRETHRGAQNAALAPMTVALIQQGHMSVDDAFRLFHAPAAKDDRVHTGGEYPASMRGAAAAMEQRGSDEENREMIEREKQIVWRWATVFLNHRRGMIVDSADNAKRIMKDWLLHFHGVP